MKKPSATLDLSKCTREERAAVLAAWVARLNVASDERHRAALDRWLSQLLDEFDEQQKGSVDEDDLRRRFDAWLDTAGETGGPEQEQDPMRPHAAAWHGNRRDSKG